ncbi:MAG: biopolymer transporter ExbD [Myxococcota bacterium]|nr:biopolymer transporter ExbD [Myxococcota bacterium]MDW8363666.1 biopolymer transporter ExbD [Myxococcales bacterium]
MAGGIGPGHEGDEIITDINVTPLVDIVLVLLIILMVTATAIVSKTIQMELPRAETGESTPQQQTLAVSIDHRGQLFLDAHPVSEAVLRERVREVRARHPDVRAIIAADGRITHDRVVRVIDLLRRERVTKFAINVRPSDLR